MDWLGMITGAGIGIVGQELIFRRTMQWLAEYRRRRFYIRTDKAWQALERIYGRLILLQSGRDKHGCFPEGSILLNLDGKFDQEDEAIRNLRTAHSDEWLADGSTNGIQVGISSILNIRVSEEAGDELGGRAHLIVLNVHEYRYFDYLATHLLRLYGTPEERAMLNDKAGNYSHERPVSSFPTPCSVGISVFCEDGAMLVLARRSSTSGSGGMWEGGKIFNAVGENLALRDFAASNRPAHETTPEVIARRGLYEEVGLSDADIHEATLKLHSFAWASDILDFKFFGYMKTNLASSELEERWINAPDRAEAKGLEFRPVQSKGQCRELLLEIQKNSSDWSPEAIFSTLRSLTVMHKISTRDLLNWLKL